MNKWLKSILIAACCVFAAILMLCSLYEREEPAKPEAAEPGPGASAAPADGSSAATPGASPAQAVDEAAALEIYKPNCMACHGDQLQGTMGPPLTAVGSSMPPDQILTQIEKGGGGMPAFKGTLTDDQIRTLTNWLAAQK
ncbi:cytochrome c [Cohnella lubricantis]|uniref:C-type cytochrome n=1 Tax=Cohnella lubricantis TaxID=2163172 RepID=A0A841TCK7_9BACL|nr:cytochrome c [Cohnella lubricantis]MBB6677896.1 c-type cytochrome [Cohnella lubricantis]MBP2119079.1 mono/diheme cytochrome c family protein [Cohnella lubricantis]